MIKVIRGSRVESWPRRETCPECGCEFEYDEEDLTFSTHIAGYGNVICPECDSPIETEAWRPAGPGDVKFPEMFDNAGDGTAKHVEDDEVERLVREGIDAAKRGDGSWFWRSGDTYIHVSYYGNDGECYVVVCRGKGLYETTVDVF